MDIEELKKRGGISDDEILRVADMYENQKISMWCGKAQQICEIKSAMGCDMIKAEFLRRAAMYVLGLE